MLRALFEHDVRPDLVLGTSVGALNGLVVASDPTPGGGRPAARPVALGGREQRRLRRRPRGARSPGPSAPAPTCTPPSRCASGSTRSSATPRSPSSRSSSSAARPASSAPRRHWFSEGPVVPAVMASAAVPGLLPPAKVGGEHYLDGGIVNSIPVGRAVELGADRVFVLQVGRVDRPLKAPRKPWEVARVSFEIARRHRFVREMAELPDGVEAHVLPAGGSAQGRLPAAPTATSRRWRAASTRRTTRAGPTSRSTCDAAPGGAGAPAGRARAAVIALTVLLVDDAAAVADRRRRALAVRARAGCGRCGCSGCWCCT